MLKYHFRADPKPRSLQLHRGNRLCHYTVTPHVTDKRVRHRLREVVGRCMMSLASAGLGEPDGASMVWLAWRFQGKDNYECVWFVWRVRRHCL